ncbi:MAG: hypothetical protein JRJ45_10615 [Deltaproteobacteria bacterium]|nr:hypothetical protein [Deltaproteobacteria bacterium]
MEETEGGSSLKGIYMEKCISKCEGINPLSLSTGRDQEVICDTSDKFYRMIGFYPTRSAIHQPKHYLSQALPQGIKGFL